MTSRRQLVISCHVFFDLGYVVHFLWFHADVIDKNNGHSLPTFFRIIQYSGLGEFKIMIVTLINIVEQC